MHVITTHDHPAVGDAALEVRARRPSALGRRWADWPLERKGLVVLAIPVLPLLLTTALYFVMAHRHDEAEARVRDTHAINTELMRVFALLLDAESSARGLALSGNRDYERLYREASAALDERLSSIESMLGDDAQRRRHRELRRAVGSRLDALDVVVRRPEAAADGAQFAEGKRRMQNVRTLMSEMTAAQQQLLTERQARAVRFERGMVALAVTTGVLGIAGGISASILFTSTIVERVKRAGDNARRLALGEALQQRAESGDEIGVLNRDLEDAARLMEERRRQLNRRMQQLAEVNRELESFSYSVSHDLRAPLRHMTGFAALLEKQAGDRLTDADRRHLRTIREAAAKMGRLIDALLSFSRMARTDITRAAVDMNALVDEVIADVQPHAASRHIRWTREPLPTVQGDAAMLHAAFANLIANAVKYTSTRPDAEIRVGVVPSTGGEHVFYVQDNGVGFDMAYADKLFGVFQRLHAAEEFEGTGIGLASVRRIAERHGGRTWAHGEVGRGATFYLTLPVAEGAAA